MAAKLLGQLLSEEEERRLDEWLDTSLENRMLFERLAKMQDTRELIKLNQEKYGERMAGKVMARIDKQKSRSLKRLLYIWSGGVAAILVGCAIIFSLFLRRGNVIDERFDKKIQSEILPGAIKATLTFADGQVVRIVDTTVKINMNDHLLTENKISYHTLSVPAGGEFFYELADGTKVWLNSESEIRFPATFADSMRQVYVKGEAFFDVAKDRNKPFVVSLSRGDITVYGTRFGVHDYETSNLSAVLVEGSISFTSPKGKTVYLLPSDRLVYEIKTETISVEKVDTMLYTAWMDKMFIFRGQPLEEIMTTLSRWYAFNIIFESEELKHIRLSGRLNRYQDIRILLNTYEEVAGIKFKIEGKNILISKE